MKRLERLGGRTYYIEVLSEVEAEIYGEPNECIQMKKEGGKDAESTCKNNYSKS